MKLLKILLCGLLMALPVFAEESDDRQTATSLHYVSHELDTRQNKLSAGTNAALTYTNSAGGVEQRTVKSDLTGGTTDTSLPQVNAVNAGLNTKQDDITTIDDHTAVTYTSTTGIIGQKGIYQTDGTYAAQSDNLIDAKTFNTALKNGLDNEFVCADRPDAYAPGTNTCWLWEIHNTYNAAAQPYVSATGTVVQNGTPTPTNPVEPTFYRQGNMVLRKINDTYYDSYNATTHKITRRVGVLVLDGVTTGKFATAWNPTYKRGSFTVPNMLSTLYGDEDALCNQFTYSVSVFGAPTSAGFCTNNGTIFISFLGLDSVTSIDTANAWIAAQYAAGTPVTVYYPLATPVEEDWPDTTYNENVYLPQNQQ